MISPLRAYHFMLWKLWAVFLPVGFVCAILFRPSLKDSAPVAMAGFSAAVSNISDSTSLLQISVAGQIPFPSCLLYLHFDDKNILLGNLNKAGNYTFQIPPQQGQTVLELYDPVHAVRITTLTAENKQ